VLSKLGAGRFIAPKPNRLVVIAGGTCHRISPVTTSAGDHVRCTVAGFFHRPLS
jgi:Rps23 Pro-64 3,4-dihydroxylase Tpa1-like proline 4-hydroxylase